MGKLEETLAKERAARAAELESAKKSGGKEGSKEVRWTEEEVQLLVKAATIFPVGTKSRQVFICRDCPDIWDTVIHLSLQMGNRGGIYK